MGKILLLEDDANLNETVTEFLEEQGHEVVSVYDGHEAQEKLYESKYDLLLLDVNTPGVNGFEVLKEARENDVISKRALRAAVMTISVNPLNSKSC